MQLGSIVCVITVNATLRYSSCMDSREGRLRGPGGSRRVAVTNQAMPHAAAGRPGDNRGLFLETGERRGWTVDLL